MNDARRERLQGYYEAYDESGRLAKSKSREVEFLTTVRLLERYLAPGSVILDLGAAPGRYTFHFAARGHKLFARDYLPHHVEMVRADPRCASLGIDASVADGRDLSKFEDAWFDAVLCFGPFYHIGEAEERKRCLAECLRVLKPGGVLAIAYINKFCVYALQVQQNRDYLEDRPRESIMDREAALAMDPAILWFFDSPQEIEALLASFGVERLAIAGTDGIGVLLAEVVDSFDDREFAQWLKFHYATCEEPSILGASCHGLYVGRKRAG